TCIVASCASAAGGRDGLCYAHYAAWCRRRRRHPGAALAIWARHAGPASAAAHTVVLRGLPERVIAELLAGVQRRTGAGLQTRPDTLRCLVNLLHARRAASVLDLAGVPSTSIPHYAGAVLRSLLAELHCALSDPEREQAKDVWQLAVLGLPGTLDFTGLAPRWLREAAKRWAAEDLPPRRGQPAAGLPAAFAVRRDDIPKDPDRETRPRSLPPGVLQAIAANLHVLEERCGVSERRITELLIDTGRRPDEICALAWDCLERDASGNPVLIYTDAKNNRPGRRLPVSDATASVITAQKGYVCSRYAGTPAGDLVLF